MKNYYHTAINYLSIFLLITIFLQIILGAWVRLTGSGMSCPDWPLCYGMFFPTYTKISAIEGINYTYFQVFLEWIHRANAAFIVGPLALIIFFMINFRKDTSKDLKKLSIYLFILLSIQGLLGGLTVIKSNIPWSVAIHLSCAFLLFFVVLNMCLELINKKELVFKISPITRTFILLSGLFTIITASAGAFTSKYGASLACANWPNCNDNFFPDFSDMFESIHFFHRTLVAILLFFLFIFFIKILFSYKKLPRNLKYIFFGIPTVVFFQIAVGASLIYLKIPIWLGIFHQATGLLLFSLISIMFFYTKTK